MNKNFNICQLCANGKTADSVYGDCYNCVGAHSDFQPGNNLKQFLAHQGYTLQKNKHTPVIIMGFPGIGKTYLKEKLKGSGIRILDSDSSNWHGDTFPDNYIKYIEKVAPDFDIILISTHKAVREAVKKSSLMETCAIHICYPNLKLKSDWLDRLTERGNIEQFVDIIDKNYDEWIKDLENETSFNHIIISYKEDNLYNNLYNLNFYNLNRDVAFKLQKISEEYFRKIQA